VILTGIRFKGMNIEMPFVDLVAASFELSDGQRLAETLKVIERDYNALKPKWIRIMQWRGEGVSWPTDSAVTPDIAYLASPTSKLKALPPPQGCEILEVRRCQDLDFYPVYRREHDAFRAASSFGQDVPISTREDLARCLEEGLLYEARVEGSWAGLIAAAAESFYGISALCIHEEILCEPLRGKGLGPALQRKMIDAVDKDILIYGTIDARNLASLKTAKRVGREQVAQRLFCTLSTARSALD